MIAIGHTMFALGLFGMFYAVVQTSDVCKHVFTGYELSQIHRC